MFIRTTLFPGISVERVDEVKRYITKLNIIMFIFFFHDTA